MKLCFVSMAVHEFRTLLTPALTSAVLIRKYPTASSSPRVRNTCCARS